VGEKRKKGEEKKKKKDSMQTGKKEKIGVCDVGFSTRTLSKYLGVIFRHIQKRALLPAGEENQTTRGEEKRRKKREFNGGRGKREEGLGRKR